VCLSFFFELEFELKNRDLLKVCNILCGVSRNPPTSPESLTHIPGLNKISRAVERYSKSAVFPLISTFLDSSSRLSKAQ